MLQQVQHSAQLPSKAKHPLGPRAGAQINHCEWPARLLWRSSPPHHRPALSISTFFPPVVFLTQWLSRAEFSHVRWLTSIVLFVFGDAEGKEPPFASFPLCRFLLEAIFTFRHFHWLHPFYQQTNKQTNKRTETKNESLQQQNMGDTRKYSVRIATQSPPPC